MKQYCHTEAASARAKGEFTILSFVAESEADNEEWDDRSGWLSALTPLRSDLAAGEGQEGCPER